MIVFYRLRAKKLNNIRFQRYHLARFFYQKVVVEADKRVLALYLSGMKFPHRPSPIFFYGKSYITSMPYIRALDRLIRIIFEEEYYNCLPHAPEATLFEFSK